MTHMTRMFLQILREICIKAKFLTNVNLFVLRNACVLGRRAYFGTRLRAIVGTLEARAFAGFNHIQRPPSVNHFAI